MRKPIMSAWKLCCWFIWKQLIQRWNSFSIVQNSNFRPMFFWCIFFFSRQASLNSGLHRCLNSFLVVYVHVHVCVPWVPGNVSLSSPVWAYNYPSSLDFFLGAGDLNSGVPVYVAGALPTEPSPLLLIFKFLRTCLISHSLFSVRGTVNTFSSQ